MLLHVVKAVSYTHLAGDLKFVDHNGDGKITDADRQYMGSATPKTTFALSLIHIFLGQLLACFCLFGCNGLIILFVSHFIYYFFFFYLKMLGE